MIPFDSGLAGTAQLDASESLLDFLDKAESDGYEFNGSVVRRALKALINEDFAHSSWQNLVGKTKSTIDSRFIADSDGIDASSYYGILCGQIMQKLLRTATQRFKSKDI